MGAAANTVQTPADPDGPPLEDPDRPSLRVGLLIGTSISFGRRVVQGVLQYARSHRQWNVLLTPEHDRLPIGLNRWEVDGWIVRPMSQAFATWLERVDRPVVVLPGRIRSVDRPGVTMPGPSTDPASVARLVLDHFLDRGYHHLGLCGFRRSPEGWLAQLHRQAEQRGIDCAYFGGGQGRLRDLSGAGDRPRLEAWLKALPRPAGVLAYNDLRGRHVLEAARRMGLGVPEQLAVVGVGDDELICESTDPPLSSVLTPAEAIGHAAAQMLHDKLAGRTPGPGEALPARRLVARASSDQVAIRDPVVAAAIRFIRAQAIRGADVNAVLAALPVSRTTLEQRFKKVLGRTPHAEVHRVRVERAKELLELTELSVQVVAQRSGFGNATRLAEAMRRAEAMTPSQFRTAARQR